MANSPQSGSDSIRPSSGAGALRSKSVAWGKLLLASSFLILGLGLVLLARRLPHLVSEPTLSADFSSEPVKSDFSTPSQSLSKPPERVIIPDLEIDLPIKFSPIIRGYWQVWPDAAGWGEGSAPPGDIGNSVIFAHARKGLFLPLKNIVVGTRVYLLTQDKYFSYRVSEIKTVFPYELEVIAPTPDRTLTLYTCSGFGDKKRLIVVAKPL